MFQCFTVYIFCTTVCKLGCLSGLLFGGSMGGNIKSLTRVSSIVQRIRLCIQAGKEGHSLLRLEAEVISVLLAVGQRSSPSASITIHSMAT